MSYVDAAIARLKDDAERKATTPPTREVGPWTYRRIPETHGYLLDGNGVIPSDVLKTIGECEYQHEAAMNVIAALLASHANITAQLQGENQRANNFSACLVAADKERDRLTAQLAAAEADARRFKDDYLNACRTISRMYDAAMQRDKIGEFTGPKRGVVEDIADLRAERDALAEKWGSMVDDHGDPLDAPAIAEYVCIIREELSHMTADRDALRKDAADARTAWDDLKRVLGERAKMVEAESERADKAEAQLTTLREPSATVVDKGWSLLQTRCFERVDGSLDVVDYDDFADALCAALDAALAVQP